METFFVDIGIVIVFSAALSWVALRLRQPIITAYLLCGVIAGPWGLGLVREVQFMDAVSRIGVTLLLFLAGIVLHPRRWAELFRKITLLAVASCLATFVLAEAFGLLWGFGARDSAWVGMALMFSSTILVLKLLPTTTLHQRHMGAACIALLIVEDLIAVGLLVFLGTATRSVTAGLFLLPLKAIVLVAFSILFEQFVLRRIMQQCEEFHETLYLLALAWCLGMALLASRLGFSYEVGAFVAGVALARSPLSLFLSEGLKPFRDFFLVLFFFVLGAKVNLYMVREVALPAILLTALFLGLKPVILYGLFRTAGEEKAFAKEIGLRLNQTSEFSLIIAGAAAYHGLMSPAASHLAQLTTILTMIVSCYIVVFNYPTPLGTMGRLKQD